MEGSVRDTLYPEPCCKGCVMAFIDVAGFVSDMKSHAVEHGFHVHDERHFVETYSLRQMWEVDLHPEEACDGPIDLHLSLEVDPRALLGFEDEMGKLDDPDQDPPSVLSSPYSSHGPYPHSQVGPTFSCWRRILPELVDPNFHWKSRPLTQPFR